MKKPSTFLSVILIAGFSVAARASSGRNVAPHGREGGVVVGSPLAGHEGGGLVVKGPLALREGGG
jgi:hypothetical protein